MAGELLVSICLLFFCKRPFIKDVSSQRGGEIRPVRTFFSNREGERVLQIRTSTLFGAKKLGFFEIYDMSAQTREGGLASADIFRTRGKESQFFAILCRRLLWTDPNRDWPILFFEPDTHLWSQLLASRYYRASLIIVKFKFVYRLIFKRSNIGR